MIRLGTSYLVIRHCKSMPQVQSCGRRSSLGILSFLSVQKPTQNIDILLEIVLTNRLVEVVLSLARNRHEDRWKP